MHKYLNSERLFCSDVIFYSQVVGISPIIGGAAGGAPQWLSHQTRSVWWQIGNSERLLGSIILSSQVEEFQKLKIQSASSMEKPQEVKVFPRLPSAAGCQDGSRKRQIGF